MRLSDIGDKEIINIHDGSKLGIVSDTDIIFDKTGKIKALLLSPRFKIFRTKGHEELVIPWNLVCKIGDHILFVDIDIKEKYY